MLLLLSLSLALCSKWYIAEKKKKKKEKWKPQQSLPQNAIVMLFPRQFLHACIMFPLCKSLHAVFTRASRLRSTSPLLLWVASVCALLIVGITATTTTSREPVLDPPDEETEECEEDEEDDDDDGDDDVALHCCVVVYNFVRGVLIEIAGPLEGVCRIRV